MELYEVRERGFHQWSSIYWWYNTWYFI